MLNLSIPSLSGRPSPSAASQDQASSASWQQASQLPMSRSPSTGSLPAMAAASPSRPVQASTGWMPLQKGASTNLSYEHRAMGSQPVQRQDHERQHHLADGDFSVCSSARSEESGGRGPSLQVPGLGRTAFLGPAGRASSSGLSAKHLGQGAFERGFQIHGSLQRPDDPAARIDDHGAASVSAASASARSSARSAGASVDDQGYSAPGREQSGTDAQSARSSSQADRAASLDRDLGGAEGVDRSHGAHQAWPPVHIASSSTDGDVSEGRSRNRPETCSGSEASASDPGMSDSLRPAPEKRRSVSGRFEIPDMSAYEQALDSAPVRRRSASGGRGDATAAVEGFNQMLGAANGDRNDDISEFEVLAGRNETRFEPVPLHTRPDTGLESRQQPWSNFSVQPATDAGQGRVRLGPDATSLATPFQQPRNVSSRAPQLERKAVRELHPVVHQTEGRGGIGEVLSAYGQPGEWWHDSIILGRLSALAARYHAVKTTTRPWQAWRARCQAARQKREIIKRNRRLVALRTWRWRQLTGGKRKNKRPLCEALSMLLRKEGLAPAWESMRKVVFQYRDMQRQLALLCLAKARAMGELALGHYYRNLLRLGLAGFWIAVRLYHNTPRRASDTAAQRPAVDSRGHVVEVLMKTWLRWTHGVRLWVPPAIYELQQTERWLLGDNATPRAIVTDPERCDFLLQRYMRVDRELDVSDANSLQNDANSAPNAHHEVDSIADQAIELPFPELEHFGNQHRVDTRPYQLSAHGRAHAVKERILIMPLKEPATWDVNEKPIPEPPQRIHGGVVHAPTPASPTRLAGVHPPLPSSPSERSADHRAVKKIFRQGASFMNHDSDDDVDFADEDDGDHHSSVDRSWALQGPTTNRLGPKESISMTMARQPLDMPAAVDHDMDAYSRLRCRFQPANAADRPAPVKPVMLRPRN
eukprot:gnl/MRDRNA2_/MRDRNA2_112318_c0_seq1.p1 gnl/MRDRNA2_/MRDRNA2_112318_c0~~gnl/MRDRNA2_/MRDRNA2_112318_c0_seq1.p1  ORF type:complete len:930 (-),score=153.03 gnl/MRDRNA2_/MRDRNA2_112318_c0_seq1:72-2861(-)